MTETDEVDKIHTKEKWRGSVPDEAWESDVRLVKTKGRQVGILLEGEGRLRIRIRIAAGRREMKLLSHDQFVSHVQYMTVSVQTQTQSEAEQRQR